MMEHSNPDEDDEKKSKFSLRDALFSNEEDVNSEENESSDEDEEEDQKSSRNKRSLGANLLKSLLGKEPTEKPNNKPASDSETLAEETIQTDSEVLEELVPELEPAESQISNEDYDEVDSWGTPVDINGAPFVLPEVVDDESTLDSEPSVNYESSEERQQNENEPILNAEEKSSNEYLNPTGISSVEHPTSEEETPRATYEKNTRDGVLLGSVAKTWRELKELNVLKDIQQKQKELKKEIRNAQKSIIHSVPEAKKTNSSETAHDANRETNVDRQAGISTIKEVLENKKFGEGARLREQLEKQTSKIASRENDRHTTSREFERNIEPKRSAEQASGRHEEFIAPEKKYELSHEIKNNNLGAPAYGGHISQYGQMHSSHQPVMNYDAYEALRNSAKAQADQSKQAIIMGFWSAVVFVVIGVIAYFIYGN